MLEWPLSIKDAINLFNGKTYCLTKGSRLAPLKLEMFDRQYIDRIYQYKACVIIPTSVNKD